MKYAPTIKNNLAIIFISIALYTFSPSHSIKVSVQEVQASQVYSTGKTTWEKVESGVLSKVQIRWKITERKNTIKDEIKTITSEQWVNPCDASCKVSKLIELGMNEKVANTLVMECKKQDIQVVNCIKLGASIAQAESGWWNRCYKNGCFGILAWGISYDSVESGTIDWVNRFGKYWYRQSTPSSFYNNVIWRFPKTRYCNKETDTNIDWYCPNGFKNSWSMFNKLTF